MRVMNSSIRNHCISKSWRTRLVIDIVMGMVFFGGGLRGVALAQSYLTSTGSPGFALPEPTEVGSVDATSGNLHIEIPLGSFPQRGGGAPLVPKLVYDSHIWTPRSDGASYLWTTQGNWYGLDFGTWGFITGGAEIEDIVDSTGTHYCNLDYMFWDESGTKHYFNIPGTWNGTQCSGGTAYATDSSGYRLYQSPWPGSSTTQTLYAPDGTMVGIGASTKATEDANGNSLTLSTAGIAGMTDPVSDTVGRTVANPVSYNRPGTSVIAIPNPQGGTSQYTVTSATVTLKTNFQQPGITECNTNCTAFVISSIALPDGSSYSFQYDCDSATSSACSSPSNQSAYYGTMTKMTLPTGETITYGYTNFVDATGAISHWLTSKYSTYGGYWSYTPVVTYNLPSTGNPCAPGILVAGCQQVTVSRADGSTQVIQLAIDNGAWPMTIKNYASYGNGGALLSTVTNTWDFSQTCTLLFCQNDYIDNGQHLYVGNQNIRKTKTQTTVPVPNGNSITNQTTYTYQAVTNSNITAIKEWKYQNGTSPTFPSTPDRATYITYATIGTNNNIDHPLTVTVCNNVGSDSNCSGGGTRIAQTMITYDGYGSNGSQALSSVTGAVNHDDTDFGSSVTARGNPTQISQWVSGSTYLTTAISYDTTGQVTQVSDPKGNITTYSHADAFYTDNGSGAPQAYTPPQFTNAYLTSVTDAIGTQSMGYYYGSGQSALATDYNGVSTYSHYLDPFNRPTETDYPIGWRVNTYTSPTQYDSYSAVGDTTPSTSCASCEHTQALLDSAGRVVTQNLVNNPAGEVTINTVYDAMNRVFYASHPHIGSSDPNNVYEYQTYDGLSRPVTTSHPDGEIAQTFYGPAVASNGGLSSQQGSVGTYGIGYPVLTLDETGKPRQEWIDGFGRTIEVDEPAVFGNPTKSTGNFTISGTYQCVQILGQQYCDQGTVYVTIGTFNAQVQFSQGLYNDPTSIAYALASTINTSGIVTASAYGGTVFLTSVADPGTNYACSGHVSSSLGSFNISFASGCMSGGGGSPTTWQYTNYTYDALGNLAGVSQGSQTRSYQYDGLSRVTQNTTPEAGTVTYSYTNGSSLCSGNPSAPCTKTDARGIVTTYSYDAANRLTGKTHNPSTTGPETYTYGTSAASYNKGRLYQMTDPSGSETYTYDQAGRVTNVAKVINSTTYNIGYQYNTGGQLTQITYPSGRVVQYSYDDVGHLCTVAASASANCGSYTNPYLTISSSSYDAAGRPLNVTYGNGVVGAATFYPQQSQLATLSYTKGSTTLFGLNYYYQKDSSHCPNGQSADNGQINCIVDTVQPGRSVAYAYDGLDRLVTASTTGSSSYPVWGLSETYDRYGNRTNQSVTAGSGYNVSLTINPASNQISGFTYDASGNVTAETSPYSASFTYDGEECNTSFSGNGNNGTYTCDGNGLRVKKVVTGNNAVTTLFIYSDGHVIDEYDNGAAVNSPTREYIYAMHQLASITGSTGGAGGTITYEQRDHLSPRLFTDANGNDVGDQGTYPFGELWYQDSTTSNWVFTTYERDKESGMATGLDYALARSYSINLGRFQSPDPLGGHVGNPQSWNRYAYVKDDPINSTDPSGMFGSTGIGSIFGPAGTIIGALIDLGELFSHLFGGGPSHQPTYTYTAMAATANSGGPCGYSCTSWMLPIGAVPGIGGLNIRSLNGGDMPGSKPNGACGWGLCIENLVGPVTGDGTKNSPFKILVTVLAPYLAANNGSQPQKPQQPQKPPQPQQQPWNKEKFCANWNAVNYFAGVWALGFSFSGVGTVPGLIVGGVVGGSAAAQGIYCGL